MDVSIDKKLKIAIQGYEGSFHEIAARKYYDQSVDIVPARSFTELVNNMRDEQVCDEGIMAIENSIAGSILSNYALLEEAKLHITGEVYIQIGQHLMTLPGQSITDLHEVHSHPMAILQCRRFVRQHPHIKLIETEDTALSAKNLRQNNMHGVGAIAGELAASLYNLDIIERNIETVQNNYTRFLVLSRHSNAHEWATCDKASLHFNVNHKPGSLVKAMQVLADEGINISKIQSVPIIEHEWQYSFHIDLEFESKAQYERGIEKLADHSKELKVLGIYKNGKHD